MHDKTPTIFSHKRRRLSLVYRATLLAALTMTIIPTFLPAATFSLFTSHWAASDLDADTGIGLATTWSVAPRVELLARATFHDSVSVDTERVAGPPSLDLRLIPLEVGATYSLRDEAPLDVYAGGGLVYTLIDDSGLTVDGDAGLFALAGVRFGRASSRTSFVLEASYRFLDASVTGSIALNGDRLISQEVDLSLDGFALTSGVTLRW